MLFRTHWNSRRKLNSFSLSLKRRKKEKEKIKNVRDKETKNEKVLPE